MPQAARPAGRSPGQARRERESAGGTEAKATVRRRSGLVRGYQKNLEIVMRLLHSQKGLDPERNREVEPRFGILEVQARDLPDPVQPVAQGVRTDTVNPGFHSPIACWTWSPSAWLRAWWSPTSVPSGSRATTWSDRPWTKARW